MDTTQRAHNDRTRYRARRLGLAAVKHHARDPESPWHGRWRLETIHPDGSRTPASRWMTTAQVDADLGRREQELLEP